MIRRRMTRRWLMLSCLLISLQACGFQLRGLGSLPDHLSRLQLDSSRLSGVQQQNLFEMLQRAGVRLVDDTAGDAARLQVSIESLPERKLVDSAGSGQSIIRLSRELSYSLVDASGQRLVDNKTLILRRDLELDENNLLGTEGEKQSTLENLDNGLFNSLMIQLRRL